MRTQELFEWIRKRHTIWWRRQQGYPKPWTDDPILQQYRFCNVYRELDTVTQWIARNWRHPHEQDIHLWFAMAVARLINWPETLEEIGYPVPWNPKRFVQRMGARQQRKAKLFTGAYMIHADAVHSGTKAEYLAEGVLTPLWKDREQINPFGPNPCTFLEEFHERLMKYRDMGSFMAAQVVADLKYVPPLSLAPDWYTWAASGAGSERGLNRVLGLPVKNPWSEIGWFGALHELHLEIEPLIREFEMPALHAQDLQNCLCEFDKYERVRLGEGRPRSLYAGV